MNSQITRFDNLINASIRCSEFKLQSACGNTDRHVACLFDIVLQSTATRFPSADNYKFKPHLNRTDVVDKFTVSTSIFGAFAKLRKATFVMSVHLSARNNSPPTGRSVHEIWYEYPSKICLEVSSLIKIWEEKRVLYMKTNIHLWSYRAHFALEWEMFQTKDVGKIKTHILCSITFNNSTFCPYNVFMYSVWISEQTAIISLYSTNWLVFITVTGCLLRGTDWMFQYNSRSV